jgi:uncharacterized repeat protein (TIGR01451 family)/LPXTG-motif cell wall-anchored protein
MTNKLVKKLIVIVTPMAASLLVAGLAGNTIVYADCEPIYGGGQNCVYNKSFRVTKDVRIVEDNDSEFKDKVTDVKKHETVEFRIKIKNVGEVEVDNMKMRDKLPDELERVSGDGLTEEWDDFEPGETKEFKIIAKIHSDEFDRENFDKCVVNKAELTFDGKFEGADTATVCFGKGEVTELPSTGPGFDGIATGLAGLGLTALGVLVKRNMLKI